MTMANNLHAIKRLNDRLTTQQTSGYLNTDVTNQNTDRHHSFRVLNDTVVNRQNDAQTVIDRMNVPTDLLKAVINFQVNSYIYYLNIQHFVNENAKKSFIEGWLKEKELQRLSLHADSLRKAYLTASDEQREKISAEIIKSEQEIITLNEQIPAFYEKAREEEDLYWQSSSMDEINKFQQKISRYGDSITQRSQQAVQTTVPDTITLYLPTKSIKEPEPQATVTSGIIYKIQIGAYKGKIPDTANKLIKKISLIRKVENTVDDKGMKVYTTGNLRTYAEAETMLSQVKQEGIKNAVITAYQNGKKITVPEARKLNNEL